MTEKSIEFFESLDDYFDTANKEVKGKFTLTSGYSQSALDHHYESLLLEKLSEFEERYDTGLENGMFEQKSFSLDFFLEYLAKQDIPDDLRESLYQKFKKVDKQIDKYRKHKKSLGYDNLKPKYFPLSVHKPDPDADKISSSISLEGFNQFCYTLGIK